MPALILTPAAQAEVVEAVEWYERQSPGLGALLIAEFNRTVARVSSNPQQFR